MYIGVASNGGGGVQVGRDRDTNTGIGMYADMGNEGWDCEIKTWVGIEITHHWGHTLARPLGGICGHANPGPELEHSGLHRRFGHKAVLRGTCGLINTGLSLRASHYGYCQACGLLITGFSLRVLSGFIKDLC